MEAEAEMETSADEGEEGPLRTRTATSASNGTGTVSGRGRAGTTANMDDAVVIDLEPAVVDGKRVCASPDPLGQVVALPTVPLDEEGKRKSMPLIADHPPPQPWNDHPNDARMYSHQPSVSPHPSPPRTSLNTFFSSLQGLRRSCIDHSLATSSTSSHARSRGHC